MAGVSLKINALSKARDDSGANDASAAAEKEIKVEYTLPNGSTITQEAKVGFTVEQLKAFVEQHSGIEYSKLALFYKDKPMPDPLSLNDIINPAEPCHVKVVQQ